MVRAHRLMVAALAVPLVLTASSRLYGAPPVPDEPPDLPAEPGPAPLTVVSDGQKHFVVFDGEMSSEHVFYGDGKSFWLQRVHGGGGQKNEKGGWVQRSLSFWEPRVIRGVEASLDLRDGRYTVTCATRTTELKPLPEADAKALLAAARWWKPRWKYRAHALARDNTGTYYYVDHAREPEGNNDYRLYSGQKGNLKRLKMTNVVSDSQGDIFSTRTGELRLVLNRGEYAWVKGKTQLKLLAVPVEDNHVLIYTDLGVYSGRKLGTPCDDL